MHRQQSSGTKSEPIKRLTTQQLEEFRCRHAALRTAQHNFLLVQEAYGAWVKKTAEEYGLAGSVQIDLNNGALKNG